MTAIPTHAPNIPGMASTTWSGLWHIFRDLNEPRTVCGQGRGRAPVAGVNLGSSILCKRCKKIWLKEALNVRKS